MISNKTLATLFLITLNMRSVASTTPNNAPGPGSSDKPALVKKPGRAPKPREVLVDTSNNVDPVEVQRRSDGELDTSQKLASDTKISSELEDATNTVKDVIPRSNQVTTQGSVWQRLSSWIAEPATEKFKKSMEEGSYWVARCLTITMNEDDLLKLVCSTVKTIEKYNGIVKCLERRKMVASFYVYGDIGAVKEVIVESRVYVNSDHVENGALETALLLALKEDHHDRVVELLDVRKGITAEMDRQCKLRGRETSFEWFVYWFLGNPAPWEDGMALRRLIIFCAGELKNKYRDVLDTLCLYLVYNLRDKPNFPNARELLDCLIGQPSLLTPVVFARGFLYFCDDRDRSNFITYGWREAIQEGLKTGHYGGGEKLWLAMRKEKPDQFRGEFPDSEEARAAVCMRIPTKQEKEEQWADRNDEIFYNELKNHESVSYLLPDVLWPIIFGYVISRPDIDDPAIPK